MNKRIEHANLLPNRFKTKLTPLDLFDRIINLRLNAMVDGKVKSYYIRSDYETYFPKQDITKAFQEGNVPDNKCIIRKCRMKPSIKVQYKMVCQTTAVEIDIWVSNFFMIDSTGQNIMKFDKSEFPLETVDVQMGYWGQFNWANFNMGKSYPSLEELKAFVQPPSTEQLTVQVLYVTTDKLPPDSTLHIHGVVGANTFLPPVSEEAQIKYDDLVKSKLNVKIGQNVGGKASKKTIDNLFYQNITQRFIKNPTMLAEKDPKAYASILSAMEKNRKANRKIIKEAVVEKGNVIEEEIAFTKADAVGIMGKEFAKKYGVKVYCSEGAGKLYAEAIDNSLFSSNGDLTEMVLFVNDGFNVTNAMNRLIDVIGLTELQFRPTPDGDFLVYLASEAEDPNNVVFMDLDSKDTVVRTYYENIIPAVYSINVDGALATITCPYFFFVFPFQPVRFKSRYTINKNIASNYFTEATTFTVINQLVAFATVDDVNEVQMMCTAQ